MPLKVSDGMGAWIDDFQKSDAPQFKGHTKEKRRDQAIAAYLSAKKGPQKESVVEGKMKNIVTDVKSALGKIRHRVSQKGSKFIVSVDSNDEEDAQKAMKNHPLYVAGKLRVIPEETELDEKFEVGDKV